MKRIPIALLLVMLLVLAACGSSADELGERIAEEAIEDEFEGDVDVDIDEGGGEISIESDEGSLTFGGGEVPEGLDIPLLDGGEVVTSIDNTSGDTVMQAASLQYGPGAYEELVGFYTDWVGDIEATRQETSGEQASTFWAIPEHPDLGQVTIMILDTPEGPLVTVSSER
jgi:hypothetical protein